MCGQEDTGDYSICHMKHYQGTDELFTFDVYFSQRYKITFSQGFLMALPCLLQVETEI